MKWTKIAVLLTCLSTIVFSITAYADVNTFRVGHTMIRDQDYKINGIEMNGRKILFKSRLKKLLKRESVSSFFIPSSLKKNNIVYLSTQSITEEGSQLRNTNTIYQYNIKNGKLKKLYRGKNEDFIVRTLAMDDSKIILMYDLIDNSPGPCFSVWADWTDFGYLDVNDRKAGLQQHYSLPVEQVEKGKQEQEACAADI